ncbi:MAG: Gfo/Idh/MocA family oxidoreductase [Eubacteriales bacterium]|nr:Gfo/Idh/MocA family oxidoreductase [Eubacteriales bacterium]
MEKIRIGQLGIGHNHGEGKMLAFRKHPELFEVVGFAEEDAAWLERRGNLPCYAGLPRLSVPELLRRCDAVAVESAVPELTQWAQICVDAGKHIHLDKPGSGTLEEFGRMLNTAKTKRLVVQMGYMYRYNPAILRLMEQIKAGELGEIYSIHAEMSTYHSAEYRRWLSAFQGGIQYILGSHLVDLIVYLLGEPKKVTSFLKHTQFENVDVADNNLSVLEYEKALARIFVSSVEVNGWGRRQFVVSGSKGTVSILPMENPIQMTYSSIEFADKPYEDIKRSIPIADIPKDCRYDDMVRDFYAYVMGTKENPFSYAHDYSVQKVLLEMVSCDAKP